MKNGNIMDKDDKIKKNINEDQLWLRPLSVGLIRKNFIKNFNADYEQYLTDFINCSKFVKDYGNKKFIRIENQSHSECDVENGAYELDYKLLIDSKTIGNMYNYSENISIDKNGAISYSSSKKSGEYRRYILSTIFSGLSKQDIEDIENTDKNKLDECTRLVKNYIGKLKINKNILYYIPFDFFYKDTVMDTNKLKHIASKFSSDLRGFLEYRSSHITNKDTYISFISKNNIVFFKYEKNLILYDIVDLKNSDLYCKLEKISDNWEYKFFGKI